MNKALLTLAGSALLLVVACSNKPKQDLAATGSPSSGALSSSSAAVKPAVSDSALRSDSLRAESLEASRLESARKGLEDLMNRLMSEEIYFEFDQAVLTEKAKDLLSQAGDILAKEPKLYVEVEGHTDERGSEAYNMSLGGKRAQSVVQYLVNYGVTQDRLKSVSFGEEKPKVEGSTEQDYAQNRRAAFNVKIKK